jgi:hypothetical protein
MGRILTLQKCNAAGTAWATVQTCTAICDAAHGECDECVAPALKCASNVRQDCTAAGHWEINQDCMAQPQVCGADQRWLASTPAPCASAALCVVPSDGSPAT